MKPKEKKWNVLDVGLLLLALLCVMGAGFRIRERKKGEKAPYVESYTVTLSVTELPAEQAECLAVGESLYSETGILLGRVTEIQRTPSSVWLLSNGQYYEGVYGEKEVCDMLLRVQVDGYRENGALVCGSVRMIPGGEIRMRSLRGDWRFYLLSIPEN